MTRASGAWFEVANPEEVYSPGVLVYLDRMEENLVRMIRMAGGAARLRPHMKTHKLPEVIRMHLKHGVKAFKCATIAEAEMCARAGAGDLLLAYPLVGPNIRRFVDLCQKYPSTVFSAVVDHPQSARALSAALAGAGLRVPVYLDVDCGQHRTGIEPGEGATELYRLLGSLSGMVRAGVHVYDGHIHASGLVERRQEYENAWGPVDAWLATLRKDGEEVSHVVAGGTPSFPFHAEHGDRECSPGTCIFWDQGYGTLFPDLDFLTAAVLVTRVVSKPAGGRVTLDLGYKAVASESPQPRVFFLNMPEGRIVGHNEEHLIYETSFADSMELGQVIYAVPKHICPTIALHDRVQVVSEGRVTGSWNVEGRRRLIEV